MPSSQVAQAIAQGHTAVYPQAHLADNDSLSASPTTLTFSSLEPRNVTVTVDKPTTVYAGSADTTIATVSPSEQTLGASKGGKLTFAITPTTTHPAITFICFLDSDWQVACVTVTIQNRKPTPTPQPTPTTVRSPTAAPTAIPTFRFPSAAPSESPSPSPTPTPSPIIIITPPPVPTAPPPTTIPVATPTPTPAPTQPPLH